MADGLLGPGGALDPATPIGGLGLLDDVEVPGPFARGMKSGMAGWRPSGMMFSANANSSVNQTNSGFAGSSNWPEMRGMIIGDRLS